MNDEFKGAINTVAVAYVGPPPSIIMIPSSAAVYIACRTRELK